MFIEKYSIVIPEIFLYTSLTNKNGLSALSLLLPLLRHSQTFQSLFSYTKFLHPQVYLCPLPLQTDLSHTALQARLCSARAHPPKAHPAVCRFLSFRLSKYRLISPDSEFHSHAPHLFYTNRKRYTYGCMYSLRLVYG